MTKRGCRPTTAPCWRPPGTRWWASARTGRELVEQCGQLKPDLVISDIKMPDMDGIEAAGEIYRTAAVPVILVSAHHEQELIDRAMADHVMAYLVKPIKQAHLAAGHRHRPAAVRRIRGPAQGDGRSAAGLDRPQDDRAGQAGLDGNGSPRRAGGISPLAKAGQRKESQADRHRPDGSHRPRSNASARIGHAVDRLRGDGSAHRLPPTRSASEGDRMKMPWGGSHLEGACSLSGEGQQMPRLSEGSSSRVPRSRFGLVDGPRAEPLYPSASPRIQPRGGSVNCQSF